MVFDTGLTVTLLMGHLGCLTSRWSVPVPLVSLPKIIHTEIFQILGLYMNRGKTRSVRRLTSGKETSKETISFSLSKISSLEPEAIEVLGKFRVVCSCQCLRVGQQLTAKPLKIRSHM